jgi:hypothetical protein
MTRVAVVAHAGKSVGGGLVELRRVLEQQGVDDPLWYEVPKSRKAPKRVKRALAEGAELVFAWGGDGTVQRCIDVLAGSGTPLAIVPGGTANPPRDEPRHPRGHRGSGRHRSGVVTADSPMQWARTIARTAVGTTARSPFVQVTRARTIEVTLKRKVWPHAQACGSPRTPIRYENAQQRIAAASVADSQPS